MLAKKKYAKFKPESVFAVYDLAKAGHTNAVIAKVLGVSAGTFATWCTNHSLLREALTRARDSQERNSTKDFFAYLVEHLPEELRPLWEEIQACEASEKGVERLRPLLHKKGRRVQQQLFLYALVSNGFNASKACRMVGLSKSLLGSWVNNDPDFALLMDEIHWHKGNFFESALIRKVQEGDSNAVLFANRTYNRDRGYQSNIDVNVQGKIQHEHTVIYVDELDLPLEVRRQILQAMKNHAGKNLVIEHDPTTR